MMTSPSSPGLPDDSQLCFIPAVGDSDGRLVARLCTPGQDAQFQAREARQARVTVWMAFSGNIRLPSTTGYVINLVMRYVGRHSGCQASFDWASVTP